MRLPWVEYSPAAGRLSSPRSTESITSLARDLAWVGAGVALVALALPPAASGIAGFFAWVPLAHVASTRSPGRAAVLGWLHGLVSEGAALAALPAALHRTAGSAWLTSFVLTLVWALWDGGRFGLIAAAVSRAVRNGWPPLAVFPVALVASELAYPMFFPWYSFLFFQDVPSLLQGAALGGPLLLSFLAGLANVSITDAFGDFRSARAGGLWGVLVSLAVLSGGALFGELRIRAIEHEVAASPVLHLGLIQGNVHPDPQSPGDSAPAYRAGSRDLLRAGSVDLLIWPEAALFPSAPRDDLPAALKKRAFGTTDDGAEPIRVPVLAGALLRGEPSASAQIDRILHWRERGDRTTNAAVLATPDGHVAGIYDKRSLVPFGEYVPWEGALPMLRALAPRAGHLSAGTSFEPMTLGPARILVLICFEDVLVGPVRDAVEAGRPNLLVDLASDAWFGVSRVPWLHLSLARLRAVEHDRFLVHATNDGVSAVVDPAGRLTALLPPHQPAQMAVNVALMSTERTPYERLGDRPWWLLGLGATVMAVARRGDRRWSGQLRLLDARLQARRLRNGQLR